MADTQSERPGAMAAIVGLDIERIRDLCAEAAALGTVAPANLNTPGADRLFRRGGRRSTADRTGRAGRRPAGDAAERRRRLPQGADAAGQARDGGGDGGGRLARPETPLVANATGEVTRTAAAVRYARIAQIASPVLWVECVRTLRREGCDTFLELGSGRTLSGLIRQIDRDAETFAADSPKRLTSSRSAPGGRHSVATKVRRRPAGRRRRHRIRTR
ncbi:MAG: ACP S-malonyltransferase [Solirubrobacterales bacterium]|nr:ACP S-malonyltransferase [Solirubrobacterales bacterium]